jgi:hypothetical protein
VYNGNQTEGGQDKAAKAPAESKIASGAQPREPEATKATDLKQSTSSARPIRHRDEEREPSFNGSRFVVHPWDS